MFKPYADGAAPSGNVTGSSNSWKTDWPRFVTGVCDSCASLSDRPIALTRRKRHWGPRPYR